MLYHHSSTDYNVAASEAARNARSVMEKIIEKGRGRAGAVIEQVQTQKVVDVVARTNALKFDVFERKDEANPELISPVLKVDINGNLHRIHRNAMKQIASEIDMPISYADSLLRRGMWGGELLAKNFGDVFKHFGNAKKNLTRSVDVELRGFLSDKYRRLDSRPIVDSFANSVHNIGAIPVEGYALETKIAIKAALPFIFEPVPNEVMLFGVALENSDFGNGALSLRSFCLRLWCTNFAIAEEALRQIHLGKRLDENITYSNRTYELDTKTTASAVKDIVDRLLSSEIVNEYTQAIKAANDQKIDPKVAIKNLRELSKGEQELVSEAFTSADVENMPAGNTAWRLSNAISWVAGTKIKDEERKLDLMKVAGKVAGLRQQTTEKAAA